MNIEINNQNISLQFPYNPSLVDVIRRAPDGRKWMKKEKKWMLPVTINNLKHLLNNNIGNGQFTSILNKLEKPISIEDDYASQIDWKCTPFKHQKVGLNLILSN